MMAGFLEYLATAPLLADGAIGSLLFEWTGRLSELNHVYEALNVADPKLIAQLHDAYRAAGARCLTTNTFAANRAQLEPLGHGDQVELLNRAGVRLAREAIVRSGDRGAGSDPGFVLGSIGPGGAQEADPRRIERNYGPQIRALLAEGVDALLLETFASPAELAAVLGLVRRLDAAVPVVAHLCPPPAGPHAAWARDAAAFVEMVSDLGAAVAGVNCCAPWEATAFLDAVADLEVVRQGRVRLSAMPNAGGFQRIGHRYMTRVNAEFMGQFARTLARRHVRLIGGCCEVHPPHIREMSAYLAGIAAAPAGVRRAPPSAQPPLDDDARMANGPFSRRIKERAFAVSVEVLPARGTSTETLDRKAREIAGLAEGGLVDAVDVTDGSRGIPLMSPGDFIGAVRHRLGWTGRGDDRLEFIAHFTTRDLNTMGLQSRLIGYHAHHIHNVLLITGDPPKMSPFYPRSTAVFDMDSVSLIRCVHALLNRGLDFGGQPLVRPDPRNPRNPRHPRNPADWRTHFTIGAGFEPEALDAEHELERLRRKIDEGADYIMTQPVFRHEPLAALERFRAAVPILVGVMVLTGLEHARRVAQVPGVVVAPEVFERLAAHTQGADQAKVGQDLAAEQTRRVRREGWAGLYLMSPASPAAVPVVLGEGLA